MIPLSRKLEQWCLHKTGIEKILNNSGWQRSQASAELNQDSGKIISSFGNQEFRGLVGFVDMRGFSSLSQGKSPVEVRDIAAPFISVVIDAAAKHDCFIDKTIGDEVMIVMPWFEDDTVLSDAQLPCRKITICALCDLIIELMINLEKRLPGVRFSAGFAFGNLILDRVGGKEYSEWTVYGNCVNAAKRLQSRPLCGDWSENHVLAVGELEIESSHFKHELKMWVSTESFTDPLKCISPMSGQEQLKGVGSVIFVHSAIELKS